VKSNITKEEKKKKWLKKVLSEKERQAILNRLKKKGGKDGLVYNNPTDMADIGS